MGFVGGAQAAGGSSFGGDFVVSFCDGKTLEVALVDVSGKGIDAGTRALLLSGAFGGLLGSVPREDFLPACNAYMRRGAAAEGFVTAVHLSLDLASGEYVISSAGHPPAVHYDGAAGRWRLTKAHGIVLGVLPDLRGAVTEDERGVLQRGDALMLYTDGLVEAPGRDIDAGTDRLLGEAERMLSGGFKAGAPPWWQTCSAPAAAPTTAPSSSSGGPEAARSYRLPVGQGAGLGQQGVALGDQPRQGLLGRLVLSGCRRTRRRSAGSASGRRARRALQPSVAAGSRSLV